ncbi:hypothetical protein VKT23_008257 [Stygiomarasmius scandens]|uniref:F-box domain-containing protein n=1 Tax=Marasmiellus scandens TaxID=2682957 RepID=A0ABR1JKZ3_9AGAR
MSVGHTDVSKSITSPSSEQGEFEPDLSPTLLCRECLHTFPFPDKALGRCDISKIRGRYVASPLERVNIANCVYDMEVEWWKYEREIQRLEKIVEKLFQQQYLLEQRKEEYETLLSPVRLLPPEILSEIFGYHCQELMHLGVAKPSMPALTLSHTCSFWRQLALSTPSLWSSLHIDLGNELRHGEIQLIYLYLSNSSTSPLTLELEFGVDSIHNHLVVGSLLEQSHRWHSIIWRSSGHYISHMNVPTPTHGFPLLEGLSLKDETFYNTGLFKDTKALKFLDLDNVDFNDTTMEVDTVVHCAELTSIRLKGYTTLKSLRILGKCLRLQTAEVICRRNWGWDWNPVGDLPGWVHLTHLTSLTLITGGFEELLMGISAPALVSLSIFTPMSSGIRDIEQWPQEVFLSFLSRNSPPSGVVLESLKLDSIGVSDIQLLEILKKTPNLKTLEIREGSPRPTSRSSTPSSTTSSDPHTYFSPTITNNLLRKMTLRWDHYSGSSDPPEPLVPQLHTIDFVTRPSSIDHSILLDMIASRSLAEPSASHSSPVTVRKVSPLRNVSVRQGFMVVPEDAVESFVPRPIVHLEPVMLTDIGEVKKDALISFDAGSRPDPKLLGKNEYFSISPLTEGRQSFRKIGDTDPKKDDQPHSNAQSINVVEHAKEKVLRCLWWGGSVVTSDFSFVRLISSLGVPT